VDIKEKLQLPFAMDIIMLAAWGFGLLEITRSSIISMPHFNLGEPYTFRRSD
jgi:hypothetical protein